MTSANDADWLRLPDLRAGDSVLFNDMSELISFEDLVATELDPCMSPDMAAAWLARVSLKEMLRPAKFNGRMTDIALTVMDAPYERIRDAGSRGWKFTKEGYSPVLTNEEAIASFKGFVFTADARSTGRGLIGQVQAEIWYRKTSVIRGQYSRQLVDGKMVERDYVRRITYDNGGKSIKRYIAVPKIEKKEFIETNETSRKIAISVLRDSMMHPIVQPMHM